MGGRESPRKSMKKPTMESLIDQVDKLRREMSETQMYAKLILSRVNKLEKEVAALIEKCSEPAEASPPGEVVDLDEEEGNSGGMNQDQRRRSLQGGNNDELALFRKGMKNNCARLQDDVDNLLKLAQLLTNHVMGSESRSTSNSAIPEPASSSSTSTYSVEPVSNMAGRRSPTSAMGLIKTGDPTGRAESGTLSPTSLDSTGDGDAGFTAGLEGLNQGRISTTADSLDIAIGDGQNSTGALKKKRIPCRINSAAVVAGDPQDTKDASIHKKNRRISSKPNRGVSKEKRIPRTTRKPPPKLLEVGNRTGLGGATSGEPESVSTDLDTIGDFQ